MTSARFYEKLEDGLVTFTDPKASEFTRRGPTLEDLLRDFNHAKTWANKAQDPANKTEWAGIRENLLAIYRKAYAANTDPKSIVAE